MIRPPRSRLAVERRWPIRDRRRRQIVASTKRPSPVRHPVAVHDLPDRTSSIRARHALLGPRDESLRSNGHPAKHALARRPKQGLRTAADRSADGPSQQSEHAAVKRAADKRTAAVTAPNGPQQQQTAARRTSKGPQHPQRQQQSKGPQQGNRQQQRNGPQHSIGKSSG